MLILLFIHLYNFSLFVFFHYVTDVLDYDETRKPIHYYNIMCCEQDRFSLACTCILLMKKKVNGLLHSSMGYGSTCQECMRLYE